MIVRALRPLGKSLTVWSGPPSACQAALLLYSKEVSWHTLDMGIIFQILLRWIYHQVKIAGNRIMRAV